jgi:hypothetical protein
MYFRLLLPFLFLFSIKTTAQNTSLDVDTTSGFGKNLLGLYNKFNHLKFSGYLQPQFQVADTLGAKNFSGGDFSQFSNNRFMLRRARLRLDYTNSNKEGQPTVAFVFQFDGTERGVVARDFWGRFYENKLQCFAVSMGLMSRPFSQELLLSSSERETPERGRMSQILLRTERDLGAMITFEPRKKDHKLHFLKWDLMVGNGQGLTGTTDYDSRKDIISRLTVKSQKVGKIKISGGVSALFGGIRQFSAQSYAMENGRFALTDNKENIGKNAARQYYGADFQVKIPNAHGVSEIRAEYMKGQQSATAKSSETPGVIPTESNGTFSPLYSRSFDGAYFYYLQHLGSTKHQFLLKYDWYDPNTKVKGTEINDSFSPADIKYSTLGVGYIFYANQNLKIVTYYDVVKNEITSLKGFNRDLKDNIFTCRMHYRF